ncbi:twin-arginine translocase TatA/TatE family subunit [Varunaivibrio sulfuroxidans]|uniref:Sec-independent protein translocase protein TatA n=1 Tax=Varunaivibrio sulfuroxidans TaxID=1773489 RepID=A0A4R3J7D7_9PROT|nr:twin-arginine translocase TatA/TatE family subunit [Varunaivibrio sulfuroxidans]TCS61322.1 sec-independent protein translocase protein TatA [Varunaivibrio sulfuroxidans]WES31065.1 twin-arginine translocase TatA/TatE family subunit [Varunaivibrio sulfuroxidans]
MGFTGIWQWVIVLIIVLVLFGGGGKLSKLMGDMGKGLKSFKKGLKDEDDVDSETPPKTIKAEQSDAADTTTSNGDKTAHS